jgi:DNA polymerase kappa
VNNGSNLLEDDRPNSCQEMIMLWLDDYKCSLCGAELPPSFVEERLEHSDFHFAELLQKEQSSIRQASVPIQRYNIYLLPFVVVFTIAKKIVGCELDRV